MVLDSGDLSVLSLAKTRSCACQATLASATDSCVPATWSENLLRILDHGDRLTKQNGMHHQFQFSQPVSKSGYGYRA
ncbi:hypothetical protein KCU74_g3, partial [Aureobasidium melanogenum]